MTAFLLGTLITARYLLILTALVGVAQGIAWRQEKRDEGRAS